MTENTIRCTNCGLEFESDYDLEQNLIDPETGEKCDICIGNVSYRSEQYIDRTGRKTSYDDIIVVGYLKSTDENANLLYTKKGVLNGTENRC